MAKRYVVFALVLLMAWTAGAQSFRVSVDASKELGRNFTLLVYDTDSQPRVVKPKGKKGPVTFEDDVKGAVYAELRHRKIDTPLPFFLEGADITIKYNSANPEASAITGSRSNSQLRYQLEQCDGDIGCLAQYVQENPTSPVVPYILERYVSTSVSYETAAALFRQLGGDAAKSYHYRRLQQRLHQLEALAEGSPIPSFSYTGSDNRTVKIDSVLTGGSYNLIIVGATRSAAEAARHRPRAIFDTARQGSSHSGSRPENMAVETDAGTAASQRKQEQTIIQLWKLHYIL